MLPPPLPLPPPAPPIIPSERESGTRWSRVARQRRVRRPPRMAQHRFLPSFLSRHKVVRHTYVRTYIYIYICMTRLSRLWPSHYASRRGVRASPLRCPLKRWSLSPSLPRLFASNILVIGEEKRQRLRHKIALFLLRLFLFSYSLMGYSSLEMRSSSFILLRTQLL